MENTAGQSDVTIEDGYLSDALASGHDDSTKFYPNESELYPPVGRPRRFGSLEEVGPDVIASFHDEGYLVVDSGLDDATIQECDSAIDDLIDGKFEGFRSVMVEADARESYKTMTIEERRGVVRKVFNFVGVEPRLTYLSSHPAILDVLRRMMGAEPELLQDMALLKPAGIGREKAWHQDCAYFNVPTDTTVIGVWIAIDAATLENGCLHVIPESHNWGAHPHFKVRDWQICDTDVRKAESVPVPLDPGGILFWHGLTHHGSPSNRSELGRRGIQLHYRPAGAGTLTKEERLGIYGGEGLGMTC